jgi:hypothetical protein
VTISSIDLIVDLKCYVLLIELDFDSLVKKQGKQKQINPIFRAVIDICNIDIISIPGRVFVAQSDNAYASRFADRIAKSSHNLIGITDGRIGNKSFLSMSYIKRTYAVNTPGSRKKRPR